MMKYSNCCGAPIYEDTDVCSKCKEHCDVWLEDDYDLNYDYEPDGSIKNVEQEFGEKMDQEFERKNER